MDRDIYQVVAGDIISAEIIIQRKACFWDRPGRMKTLESRIMETGQDWMPEGNSRYSEPVAKWILQRTDIAEHEGGISLF